MKPLLRFCLAVLAAGRAFAQDPPTFRATTELVLVDVQVQHRKTKTAAPPLQPQDFQIYEDGVRQEIKSFSRDQLPLSLVLMFDLTDSVRPVLRRLAAGAKSALLHLKPEDEVAVMSYAASASLIADFTRDHGQTIAAIEKAAGEKSDEAAFFNEAVYRAAMQLHQSGNPMGRRVIIWLTDNLPNVPTEWMRAHAGASVTKGGLHTEQEAVRALHESGTVVAPLLLRDLKMMPLYALMGAFEAPWRGSHPPGDANKYAEWTGGLVMKLGGKQVEERLADLIDELRSRYTIGYRPSEIKAPGTLCKLRVVLAPDGPLRPKEWNVLARAGYYRK
jgi:VWFA-related protein